MKFTQRSTVDLPEPDRPKMTTTSPAVDLHVDPADHLEVAEALVQPVDADDDVGAHPAPPPPCGWPCSPAACMARATCARS